MTRSQSQRIATTALRQRVLELRAQGLTYAVIAERLQVSQSTAVNIVTQHQKAEGQDDG